jgi:hypothetical protein
VLKGILCEINLKYILFAKNNKHIKLGFLIIFIEYMQFYSYYVNNLVGESLFYFESQDLESSVVEMKSWTSFLKFGIFLMGIEPDFHSWLSCCIIDLHLIC